MGRLTARARANARFLTLGVAILVVAAGGTAVAASLITSKDIKNHAVKSVDLGHKVLKKLKRHGATGASGATGTGGATGATGATGPSGTFAGANWGIIDRNTEGSPVAALRAGPTEGTAHPPLGIGSLGIETASNQEKVAYGNEVDFAGDPVSGLDQVGFSYAVTGEDLGRFSSNTPNISLEINPHVANKGYTSMVYVPSPPPALPNGGLEWVDDDADQNPGGASGWYFTNGTVGTATGCNQVTFCSLADAKAALVTQNDGSGTASIGSVAVAKGKDYQYQGAVDALRINGSVFDFEPLGVTEQPAS